jgi:hypothetical protein
LKIEAYKLALLAKAVPAMIWSHEATLKVQRQVKMLQVDHYV